MSSPASALRARGALGWEVDGMNPEQPKPANAELSDGIGTRDDGPPAWLGLVIVVAAAGLLAPFSARAAWVLLLVVGSLQLVWLPARLARRRDHPSQRAIAWLSALLGWTGVGWLAAMVWSLRRPGSSDVDPS